MLARSLLHEHSTTDSDAMMEAFSPELARYWFDAPPKDAAPTDPARPDDAMAAGQREALAALAERVNAARCIV
jgi:hypothetical protein